MKENKLADLSMNFAIQVIELVKNLKNQKESIISSTHFCPLFVRHHFLKIRTLFVAHFQNFCDKLQSQSQSITAGILLPLFFLFYLSKYFIIFPSVNIKSLHDSRQNLCPLWLYGKLRTYRKSVGIYHVGVYRKDEPQPSVCRLLL